VNNSFETVTDANTNCGKGKGQRVRGEKGKREKGKRERGTRMQTS